MLTLESPDWERCQRFDLSRGDPDCEISPINAMVVGLLLAAFYDPVWTAGVRSGADFALALAPLLMLVSWKVPPWLVVVPGALAEWGLEAFPGQRAGLAGANARPGARGSRRRKLESPRIRLRRTSEAVGRGAGSVHAALGASNRSGNWLTRCRA